MDSIGDIKIVSQFYGKIYGITNLTSEIEKTYFLIFFLSCGDFRPFKSGLRLSFFSLFLLLSGWENLITGP